MKPTAFAKDVILRGELTEGMQAEGKSGRLHSEDV